MSSIVTVKVGRKKRENVPANVVADSIFGALNEKFDGSDGMGEGLSFAAEVAQRVQRKGVDLITKDDIHDIEGSVDLESFYQRHDASIAVIDAVIQNLFK